MIFKWLPCAHLFGLSAELGLGLQLLGEDVLLLEGLLVLAIQILDNLLVILQLFLDLLELGLLLEDLLVILGNL